MRNLEGDDDLDPNLLGDGESMHVPMQFCDAAQRDLAAARAKTSPRDVRDSVAFPRPRRGVYAVDSFGSTMGLHRPGPRYPAGGPSDQWLFDADRDEARRARDAYERWLSRQWHDGGDDEDGADQDEIEGRRVAITKALREIGASPNDVLAYQENLDDDQALGGDLASHVRAFQQNYGSSNNQEDHARRLLRDRQRLEALYKQRDFELMQQWRHNK
jgi:hypothetical protein